MVGPDQNEIIRARVRGAADSLEVPLVAESRRKTREGGDKSALAMSRHWVEFADNGAGNSQVRMGWDSAESFTNATRRLKSVMFIYHPGDEGGVSATLRSRLCES